jgi:hypothetical protein
MWAAVRLCHTQVSQKIGYRLRGGEQSSSRQHNG